MEKVKKDIAVDNEQRLAALERENVLLRQRIEANDAEKRAGESAIFGSTLGEEMRKIRAAGRSEANVIKVHEVTDHKNISLWDQEGQRIGPLHPDNAISTLERFARIGVRLSIERPTVEQIEAYRRTTEFQAIFKKRQQREAEHQKSRRGGQLEKLAESIAAMAGVKVDEINHVLKPHEVRPLSETRPRA